jgi:hypothetical protein
VSGYLHRSNPLGPAWSLDRTDWEWKVSPPVVGDRYIVSVTDGYRWAWEMLPPLMPDKDAEIWWYLAHDAVIAATREMARIRPRGGWA